MSWSKAEEKDLLRLCKTKMLASEIAEKIGRKPGCVRGKMRLLGIRPMERAKGTGQLAKGNRKHFHLRNKAMTYFLTHSFQETANKFGLTVSEFKSLQTVAYQDPSLKHLRKDTRRNDVWSYEETMFLLKASGIQPREWIARKLSRGTMQSVKEMLSRLDVNSRYVNGFPKRLAEELIGKKIDLGFKVKAGPTAPGVDCRPILVPWVILHREAKKSKTVPSHIVSALKALALFQRRIHGTRSVDLTVESIQNVLRRR